MPLGTSMASRALRRRCLQPPLKSFIISCSRTFPALTRTISTSQKTPASLVSHQQSSSHPHHHNQHHGNPPPPEPPNFSKDFTFGAYQPARSTSQTPITRIRYPQFASLEAEREFRKLHHAVALRWLGYQGYNNEGAGGHVTVRDPILTDHFWINPHGRSFSWMRPEDLVLMGPDGSIVDGQGGNMHSVNPAGWVIHSAVHEARPDVIAAVHCHSVPSKAFSSLGCKLEPINQDACRFYNDHGQHTTFGGIAFKSSEGSSIAAALGNTKAVILQNHGHLTVGKTVDGAAFLLGAFDRCIQAQLLADAACAGRSARDGAAVRTKKVSHEEAEYTRNVYNDEMVYIMFQSAFEDIVRASGGELPMHVQGELPRE